MPLTLQDQQLAETSLKRYCDSKIPFQYKDKIKLSYKFRGDSVTLVEHRPYFDDPKDWSNMPIAQFRFNRKDGKWKLYYADRNSRWHDYFDADPAKSIQTLLEEVEDDPTGIFWG